MNFQSKLRKFQCLNRIKKTQKYFILNLNNTWNNCPSLIWKVLIVTEWRLTRKIHFRLKLQIFVLDIPVIRKVSVSKRRHFNGVNLKKWAVFYFHSQWLTENPQAIWSIKANCIHHSSHCVRFYVQACDVTSCGFKNRQVFNGH